MKSVNLWKSSIIFLIGFALGWIGLSILIIPKYWVALVIAVVSFGFAAYYTRFRTPQRAAQPQSAPWLFVVFGAIAVALAIGMWVSPPPTPTPAMWLGMLSGVLLGGVLLAVSQSGKSS
jgi:hypothetical protein